MSFTLYNKRAQWQADLAALIAGSIMPFAFAPYSLWPLSILSCAVLLKTLTHTNTVQCTRRSFLFALGFYGFGVYWVYFSIALHGSSSVPLALALTSAFILLLSVFFALPFALFGKYLSRTPIGWLIGFPAVWVINEWIKSWLFTGFPWLYLGYAGTDTWATSLAPIFGIYGISFAFALSASLLFIAFNKLCNKPGSDPTSKFKSTLKPLGLVAVLWLSCLGLKNIQWTYVNIKQPITVGMMQGNIPQERKWDPDFAQPTLNIFRELSQSLWDLDWVIWPEAALPVTSSQASLILEQINNQAKKSHTVFFTGIIVDEIEDAQFYNSIMALGLGNGVYYKQRLVPFGEYVPLERYLRGLIHFFDLPTSFINVGPDGQEGINSNGVHLSPSICYEIVYPDLIAALAHDSEVLLTISNDAWFGDSIGPLQHFMMSRMRAVETGRYLIRSTNNGISAIVDPQGNIMVKGQRFTRETITGEVYTVAGITPFMAWRSWPVICLCFLAIILVARFQRYQRRFTG